MRHFSKFSFLILVIFNIRRMSSLSTTPKQAALIFLHGLGDTPSGWSSLESALPKLQPNLKKVVYVFPAAPTIPISINGGMKMPGWFDLFDWPIGVGVRDDKEGKLKAVLQIEDHVKDLEDKGIPRNRIVVGGFSQGGAIALLSAYYSSDTLPVRKPFAACAVLSGWLTLHKDMVVANKETPLFWAHGAYDDKVLFEQQAFGVQRLQDAGVKVEHEVYPMGHESAPDEIASLAKFLNKILFEGDDDQPKEL